jgi:hypothetical protein
MISGTTTVIIPPIGIIKVMVDQDGVKKYSINDN